MSKLTLLALLSSTLIAGCSYDHRGREKKSDFNFQKEFGSLKGVDFICHYADFSGYWEYLDPKDLEEMCKCELISEDRIKYRSTLFVISNGELRKAEVEWADLGYSGSELGWRNEKSLCFSADRLSLDGSGNLVISGGR